MRPSWDEYFMSLARVVSSRGTCDRKLVGAVLVRERTVLSCGYNGSVRGMKHCDEVGHLMEGGHCTRTLHAEQNAIAQAAMHGTRIAGADLYVTASPCWICFKLVANVGVKRIVYGEPYRLDDKITEMSSALGIQLVHLEL